MGQDKPPMVSRPLRLKAKAFVDGKLNLFLMPLNSDYLLTKI